MESFAPMKENLTALSEHNEIFMPKHLAGSWCVNSNRLYIMENLMIKYLILRASLLEYTCEKE